jgi:hypothetical protein
MSVGRFRKSINKQSNRLRTANNKMLSVFQQRDATSVKKVEFETGTHKDCADLPLHFRRTHRPRQRNQTSSVFGC